MNVKISRQDAVRTVYRWLDKQDGLPKNRIAVVRAYNPKWAGRRVDVLGSIRGFPRRVFLIKLFVYDGETVKVLLDHRRHFRAIDKNADRN